MFACRLSVALKHVWLDMKGVAKN